jgi:predicted regulator of Ras-like GTPase activity (Roadblock/LC7/MglB family)
MVQSGIMNYKGTTAGAGMLKKKISEFIGSIRAIEGVVACAIVSRDGIVTGKYFDRDLNEAWLGDFFANILSSAESIGRIIWVNSHESGAIRTQDTSQVVRSARGNFPFNVNINARADPSKVNNPMLPITKTIRESM